MIYARCPIGGYVYTAKAKDIKELRERNKWIEDNYDKPATHVVTRAGECVAISELDEWLKKHDEHL